MAGRNRHINHVLFVACVIPLLVNMQYSTATDEDFACNYTLHTNYTTTTNGSSITNQFIQLSCVAQNASSNSSSLDPFELSNQTIAWYRLGLGNPKLVEEEQWMVSERDEGVTFICAEGNADGDLEVLCDVTPLKVSPEVTVKRALFDKEMAIFVCVDDGMPGVVGYNWFVDDVPVEAHGNVSGLGKDNGAEQSNVGSRNFDVYGDSVMKVSGLTPRDKGMLVTCEVVSSNGLRANGSIAYSAAPGKSANNSGLTTDKVFLFGLIFAGGAPIVFAVFAVACLVARSRAEKPEEQPKLTVEEQDMVPIQRHSLPRSVHSQEEPSDNGAVGLYRSHSTRSTKDKVGRLSQLVLPPIDGESSSRVSQHIYDEAPHFTTSELALSRGGKHSSTLPAGTYKSRSSLYRLSADYADVVNSPPSAGYAYVNVRSQSTSNAPPRVVVHERNGHVTLPPAVRL